MVIYNAATRELTAKIVYYGPGLCGKTTNLKVLHDRLEPGTAGKLLNLQTQTDRTIYFDLLPVELGDIKGYKIRFQLATVPGQTAFNETRRVVLKGVDGIVFVADSQWTMLPKNLESWQNLKDNLKSNEISFEKIPVVIQYNKRDLADILAVDAMQEALGLSSYPFVEAVASAGRGVTETFKLISKLTFVDLLRRLQGKRAEEAPGEEAGSTADERADDLQTWKDSLLKRESAPSVQVQRPSNRPLSLVPPVSDEAPFDTTELGRGVDDEEEGESPYAVPEPPGLESGPPVPLAPSPSATIEMDAIAMEELSQSLEPPEELSEDDVVEHIEPEEAHEENQTHDEPAFLASEAAASVERLGLLEQRLQEAESRAGREREEAERLNQAVSAIQERVAATLEHLSSVGDRLSALEKGIASLQEAIGAVHRRIDPVEGAAARSGEIEGTLRGVEGAIHTLEERIGSDATRQRKDVDDLGMALQAVNEKIRTMDQQVAVLLSQTGSHEDQMSSVRWLAETIPQLEARVAALPALSEKLSEVEGRVSERLADHEGRIEGTMRQHRDLEANFEEKTQLGRREAEDIRSQIAPLLEERVRRHEADALLFAEMERLRESLAESLHDLAERLRQAVR
ncbi:MAG TPA: ADP-ribosylation factor-like protein [Thermoanaerobaculia bacterium]|nr:ADP-ribosylation factor-like protein [Thermoanaerobaculia bacterium]